MLARMTRVADLTEIAGLLHDDPRFIAAIVFGSVARGTARPDSDLDLAVLYADEAAREAVGREWLALLGRLARLADRDVHLVDLDPADPSLRRAVLDSGVVLLDRSPRRLRALRVTTGIEYLDWDYARRVADAGHARRLAAAGHG